MRIVIGSDHAGHELKELIKAAIATRVSEVVDVGTHGTDAVDYPMYAAVGTALAEHRADRGILLCGSGVGASIAANRVPGIRAGLCHDTYSARQGVEHDGMNVLVIGARAVGAELARELVSAYLNATFSGEGRAARPRAEVTLLKNPLLALEVFGQSVWLDSIRRSLITSGELKRLIEQDGVRGVTSNPAIFEQAIAGSPDYSDVLEGPATASMSAPALYEALAVHDIQDAADLLWPVYEQTACRDGYVSLEVSPLLAADTAATLAEAKRLWAAVSRDNLMIKVPATPEGIPAIAKLIAGGINVNVTLIFAQDTYDRVAHAYLEGVEEFVARGGNPSTVASVASFFVSRIDAAIDAVIDERLSTATDVREERLLRRLQGEVAIANAKLAYERYLSVFSSRRWRALAARGAQKQRLLWASTATKNPRYRDVRYVEELVGPDTVNTVPPATLAAFRDHGRPRASLTEDLDHARETLSALAEAGISLTTTTNAVLADGIQLFADAYRSLLDAVERQSRRTDGVTI